MAGDPPGTIVVFVAFEICSVVTDGTGVAFGTITIVVVFTGVVVGTVSGAGVAFGTITVVVVFAGVVVGDAVIVTLVVGMVVEFVASWLLAGTGIRNSVMIMIRMSCP